MKRLSLKKLFAPRSSTADEGDTDYFRLPVPPDALRAVLPRMKWTNDVGTPANGTACVNSLAGMLHAAEQGQPLREWTDTIWCIHPLLRDLGIFINDTLWTAAEKKQATAWMHATAPKLLGTAGIEEDLVEKAKDELCRMVLLRANQPVPDTAEARRIAAEAELTRGQLDQLNAIYGDYDDGDEIVNFIVCLVDNDSPKGRKTVRCLATQLLDNLCALKEKP